jgi:hypothetical protein
MDCRQVVFAKGGWKIHWMELPYDPQARWQPRTSAQSVHLKRRELDRVDRNLRRVHSKECSGENPMPGGNFPDGIIRLPKTRVAENGTSLE